MLADGIQGTGFPYVFHLITMFYCVNSWNYSTRFLAPPPPPSTPPPPPPQPFYILFFLLSDHDMVLCGIIAHVFVGGVGGVGVVVLCNLILSDHDMMLC